MLLAMLVVLVCCRTAGDMLRLAILAVLYWTAPRWRALDALQGNVLRSLETRCLTVSIQGSLLPTQHATCCAFLCFLFLDVDVLCSWCCPCCCRSVTRQSRCTARWSSSSSNTQTTPLSLERVCQRQQGLASRQKEQQMAQQLMKLQQQSPQQRQQQSS